MSMMNRLQNENAWMDSDQATMRSINHSTYPQRLSLPYIANSSRSLNKVEFIIECNKNASMLFNHAKVRAIDTNMVFIFAILILYVDLKDKTGSPSPPSSFLYHSRSDAVYDVKCIRHHGSFHDIEQL